MKRISAILLSFILIFSLTPPILATGTKFSDVSSIDYYASAVDWAVNQRIASGTSATTFSPNDNCTQGQIITFLYRAVGSPSVSGNNPYSNKNIDSSRYYYLPMLWAYQNGIILDTDLNPNAPCTRAETILYIWRYCGTPIVTPSSQFKDLPASNWSFDVPVVTIAASWAVEEGIASGTSSNTFSPDSICTRAQVITFLWRALSNQKNNSPNSSASNSNSNNKEITFDQLGTTISLGKELGFTFSTSAACADFSSSPLSSIIVSSSDKSIIEISSSEFTCSQIDNTANIVGHVEIRGNLLGSATIVIKAGDKVLMTKYLTVASDMPAILANGKDITSDNIRKIIYDLRPQYPEGMPWDGDASYYSMAMNHTYTACNAFARLCSDAAFGNLPISDRHSDFDRIRVGDWIGYDTGQGTRHAVIVLEKRNDSIVVAEGNYNNQIHWGRVISRQELEVGNLIVESRYTVKN